MTYQTYYQSPMGSLLLVSDGRHLLQIITNPQNTASLPAQTDPVLDETIKWLDRYFAGLKPCCSDLPLSPKGTPFQQRVWQYLQTIPYGQTTTYREIAAQIAHELGVARMSAQAIGQAVGANPLPIIIPCHRVLGQNGKLTGYAAGLAKKIFLLNHEQAKYKE